MTKRRYEKWDERKDTRLRSLWVNLDVSIEAISGRLAHSESFIRKRVAELGLPSRAELRAQNRKAA